MTRFVTLSVLLLVLLAFLLGLATCSKSSEFDFATIQERGERERIQNAALEERLAMENESAARLAIIYELTILSLCIAVMVLVTVLAFGASYLSLTGAAVGAQYLRQRTALHLEYKRLGLTEASAVRTGTRVTAIALRGGTWDS